MARTMTVEERLKELNEVLQRAAMTYDTGTIRELITRDFSLITSGGRVMDADDFLADVANHSVTWYANESEDTQVRSYNDNCAIVTAILHERFQVNGQMTDVRVRFTDTWVLVNDGWRYAAGHASRLQ